MTATALFFTVMGRDIRLALRRPSDALYALLQTATLFPLATSPEAALLRAIGPGVLWVSALLATLILLGDLFELTGATARWNSCCCRRCRSLGP